VTLRPCYRMPSGGLKRPFAHPVIVAVYAKPEAYAAANGLGSVAPVGVTFFGRVNLSPKLFRSQHQRLPAILTHELSHAHIQGWIGEPAYVLGLPNWFKEGLALPTSRNVRELPSRVG
jgi:hypothetical protein